MDKLIGAITKDDDNQAALPPGNKAAGGAYPPMMGNLLNLLDNDDDVQSTADLAAGHAGSHGSSDMFRTAMGMLSSKKEKVTEDDLDEDDAVKKHKKYFVDEDDDDEDEADSHSMGTAAAMQALKMFTSGNEPAPEPNKKSESAFMAIAMSEASKLFDQKAAKGKVASGTEKESAIEKAGEMAMKMYFKSQAQQQGGLMGMASKFM